MALVVIVRRGTSRHGERMCVHTQSFELIFWVHPGMEPFTACERAHPQRSSHWQLARVPLSLPVSSDRTYHRIALATPGALAEALRQSTPLLALVVAQSEALSEAAVELGR